MRFSRQEYWSELFLHPGIFLIQKSNPGFLHCRQILYSLSHQGRELWIRFSETVVSIHSWFQNSHHTETVVWRTYLKVTLGLCTPIYSTCVHSLTCHELSGLHALEHYFFCLGTFSTSVSQSVSSITQLCPTLYDPMNCSTPGLPVHHELLEFTQTHVHWVGDAIEPSHPLSSPYYHVKAKVNNGEMFKRTGS